MDDATAEQLLRGRTVDARPELAPLAALIAETRALGETEPAPSTALAALLRDGFTPAAATAPLSAVPVSSPRSRRRHRLAAVAGMSLGLKVLAGTGVALAGVTGAAGAGVLPAPVQDGVAGVVRTLTPFEVPPSDRGAPGADVQPDGDVRSDQDPRSGGDVQGDGRRDAEVRRDGEVRPTTTPPATSPTRPPATSSAERPAPAATRPAPAATPPAAEAPPRPAPPRPSAGAPPATERPAPARAEDGADGQDDAAERPTTTRPVR